MEKLIKKGAEAEVWLRSWMGIPAVYKVRKQRRYMIQDLDELLRRQRTVKEAKILVEARKAGIYTPTVYFVDLNNSTIIMQYVKGNNMRKLLKEGINKPCFGLGRILATLHLAGIVHGDPTTSNFIISDSKIYAIDFGLSVHSSDIEDKAVDIHLVKEILSADIPEMFDESFGLVKEGYASVAGKDAEHIIERAKTIELRGRYAKGQWG